MSYSFNPNVQIDDVLQNLGECPVYNPGDVVKGYVVGKTRKCVLVDLNDGISTGVISGTEAGNALREVEIGQEVVAVVMNPENEEGELTLSFRKAGQIRAWEKYYKVYENQEVVEVVAHAANKGGLLIDISGIKAFLPVSQLAPEHYPRVDDSNSTRILEKLQVLVGKKLTVRVIGIDKESGKLVFSEREARGEQRRKAMQALEVGKVVKGRVTGIVKFGIFVTFEELEGLVHISEIAWGHVKNPSDFVSIGSEVDIKVIGIEGEKISLSMKQLHEDPWVAVMEKYTVGTVVTGTVNKISEFGAFVTLDNDVNGLIHLTEVDTVPVEDIHAHFTEGDEVTAQVIEVNKDERRIALSTKALKAPVSKQES